MSAPTVAIIGVGPGNGMAFAHRFAREGHPVALLSRNTARLDAWAAELPQAAAFACDASDPASINAALAAAADVLGPIGVLIYNAGSGAWGDLDKVDVAGFERSWRINTLGLFAAAQAVVPGMRAAGSGVIGITGAGAAWRGRAGTIAFASAKAGQRSVGQSLARQLGPEGIHVFYAVLDGGVDPDRAGEHLETRLSPDAIADTYWHLANQHRSAWAYEIDLRPHVESW